MSRTDAQNGVGIIFNKSPVMMTGKRNTFISGPACTLYIVNLVLLQYLNIESLMNLACVFCLCYSRFLFMRHCTRWRKVTMWNART